MTEKRLAKEIQHILPRRTTRNDDGGARLIAGNGVTTELSATYGRGLEAPNR